jgi:hypothetical protein
MHHELPQRLDLTWYRKQAKDFLRAHTAGDAEARSRAQDALGSHTRFALSDAQHVIATEHGFARWADFKRWIESRQPEPPVGRIGRAPIASYEHSATQLVEDARQNSADAIRRVSHHHPRLKSFSGGDLPLPDARIVIAREYGFPTWRELVVHVQRAIDEYEHRPSGDLGRAFELMRVNDLDGLRAMLDRDPSLVHATYKGAASTMLEAVAQPDVFGEHLEVELGLDPRIVELLIQRGSELDGPLNLAACFNRAELVRMLLAAGARSVVSQTHGITPLQTAIYHGAREAGDLLADVGLVPDALYIAAGAGRLEHLNKWFDRDGALRPEAYTLRPNLADVGWPPAPPPRDDPRKVVDEAFAFAAYNGRLEAMQRLLERGASVNGTAHLDMTALHLAVITRRTDVARWLVEHGADLTLRDSIHNRTPLGWAAGSARDSDVHRYLQSVA